MLNKLSARSLKPMPQDNSKPQPKMIGFEMLLNMTNKDRAQEIWDRAMHPEAQEFMIKLAAFKASRGPDPGKYTGPVIDFEQAEHELEQEEPERPSDE
jgi:hypothetical protein